MFNTKWFIRLTGPWFKPKAPVSLTSEGSYSLQEIPIGKCSHDLGLNDHLETEELKTKLDRTQCQLDEANRRLENLERWYKEFEQLTHWMLMQGFWDAEDVDNVDLMKTYQNGLTRFLKELNIPIKPN